MSALDDLREMLLAEAIEAERLAMHSPRDSQSDRYHVGRMDAFSLAITLLDNVLHPEEEDD